MASQQLGHREHKVGGRRPIGKLTRELNPDHRRHGQGQWLAEHGGLRFDPADAPAEHAEAVHHRCVRVGADQGVAEGLALVGGKDDSSQVLEVHLMANPGVGRDYGEALKCLGSPAQQLVALEVALEFDRHVGAQRRRGFRRPRRSPSGRSRAQRAPSG